MATPATSPSTPSDNTAQLAKDYLNGKPILAKIITTATTGDPTGIDDVLSKNGYNVTEEGANKVLGTVPPGPDFDIKMVAGLYSFTSPPNMLSTKMRIDPLSGQLYIDEVWQSNTTDSDGNVVFTYSGQGFKLTFSVSYNESGVPKPYTFSSPSDAKIQAAGQQIVPTPEQPPAKQFAETPGWVDAGMIMTVFGGGLPFLFMFIKKVKAWKKEKDAKAKAELNNQLLDMADHVKDVKKQMDAKAQAMVELGVADEQIDLSNSQEDLQDAVESRVNGDISASADPMNADLTAVQDNARTALRNKIMDIYKEQHGGEIMERFKGFNLILDDKSRAAILDDLTRKRLGDLPLFAQTFEVKWFDDVLKMNIAQARADFMADTISSSKEARTTYLKEAADHIAEGNRVRAEIRRIEADHASEDPTLSQAEFDRQTQDLGNQIRDLDRHAADAAQRASDEQEKQHESEVKKRELEIEKDEAKREGEASAPDALRHGE